MRTVHYRPPVVFRAILGEHEQHSLRGLAPSAYQEDISIMHYYYGTCPSCKGTTYRYPTESFYRHHSDGTRVSECNRGAMQHNEYPHHPGYLYDCTACESACHCTPGHAECVYEGQHNGSAEA